MVGVLVVEARRHVLPHVAQRRAQLLLGTDGHQGAGGDEVEQLPEAVDRQHVGHVGALALRARRRDLRELAVLGRELGGRGYLHDVRLLERALGEGGEPGEALDLDVEELAAHRALLGGGIDVEDVAADRELAAVLHLIDSLVPAPDKPGADLVQVEQGALLDLEAVRAQVGVGHLLGERCGARHHHSGALGVEQGVESGDAQTDEVRRRRQVRLVAHAARRVEAHLARREVGLEVGRQVARGAVIARDHERGTLGLEVEQAGQQVRAQARRDESALGRAPRGLGQRGHRLVLVGVSEKCSEHAQRPPGATARPVARF